MGMAHFTMPIKASYPKNQLIKQMFTMVGNKLFWNLIDVGEKDCVETIAEGEVSLEVLEEVYHKLYPRRFSSEHIDL